MEASKIILQQTSLSAHHRPPRSTGATMEDRLPPQPHVLSPVPERNATMEQTKGINSLSSPSPPIPTPAGDGASGGRGSTTETLSPNTVSFQSTSHDSTALPPPAVSDDAEDTFDADATIPFVLPTSIKRAPRAGILPRRFARSNVRKPDKKNRSRDSPSFVESSPAVFSVEGKNPIALLKEEQPHLKSALKYSRPVAQVDEDLGSGVDLRLTESPDEYGMVRVEAPAGYNNSSFARPFPNRMCEMLIADDSHRNRRIMSQILQLAGYVCDTAYDGQMAVDKVNKRSYQPFTTILTHFCLDSLLS